LAAHLVHASRTFASVFIFQVHLYSHVLSIKRIGYQLPEISSHAAGVLVVRALRLLENILIILLQLFLGILCNLIMMIILLMLLPNFLSKIIGLDFAWRILHEV